MKYIKLYENINFDDIDDEEDQPGNKLFIFKNGSAVYLGFFNIINRLRFHEDIHRGDSYDVSFIHELTPDIEDKIRSGAIKIRVGHGNGDRRWSLSYDVLCRMLGENEIDILRINEMRYDSTYHSHQFDKYKFENEKDVPRIKI